MKSMFLENFFESIKIDFFDDLNFRIGDSNKRCRLVLFFINLSESISFMTTDSIKKQVDQYLPLLPLKQQNLVLEMIKSLLHVGKDVKRITRKEYNKEIDEAVSRIEEGHSVAHEDALKELSKW
jgi:hypothetical protein